MKVIRKRWTKDEDEVLIEFIKSYPNNLSYCFEKTATILKNRNKQSAEDRYYKTFKFKKDLNLFGVGSSKGVVMNTKNTPRKDNERVDQLVIRLFSKLTDEQKAQVLKKVF